MVIVTKLLRKILNLYYRKRVKLVPTIISRDCMGGVLYERLGAQFTSPTIKLFMTNEDFLLFCMNLKLFLDSNLEKDNSPQYPVGIIRTAKGNIHLYFMHYSSFEDAKECWERRKKRVNYDNIKVIFNAEPDVDESIEKNFYDLPYKKVLLSSNCFGGKDSINMRCYQKGYTGPLVAYKSKKVPVVRYMDEVNWIRFLNK